MTDAAGQELSSSLQELGRTSTKSTNFSKRYSIASTETGESSKRSSTVDYQHSSVLNEETRPTSDNLSGFTAATSEDGKNSHRSHKSKGKGGFLLSNSTFEAPADATPWLHTVTLNSTRQGDSLGDAKGKMPARGSDKKRVKKRSSAGLGIHGSLPPGNPATIADSTAGYGIIGDDGDQELGHVAAIPLDVDSAQIVNLALNLSESRRNAARKNVLTPVNPTIAGFGDGFSGGSLRQQLQQQRRSSRNISPKPERAERTLVSSPRILQEQRLSSPLQAGSTTHQDGDFHYQFSASTLARVQKAKNEIELMAQYRRLLQYLPPLKPQSSTRTATANPSHKYSGSSAQPGFSLSRTTSTTTSPRPLGRAYNPLQYIRNRKVRLRERKTIDGETEGFGDIIYVSSWVDRVCDEARHDGYQTSDCVTLPNLAIGSNEDNLPHDSLHSTLGKGHASTSKYKRPRVDWITNPADMLADVFWLEQDDNKKLIEDNRERKLFPQHLDLLRPVSHQGDQRDNAELEQDQRGANRDMQQNAKLPAFSPVRNESHQSKLARQKSSHKSKEITHALEDLNRMGHKYQLLKSLAKTGTESSESDNNMHRSPHQKNNTEDGLGTNRDILEKQMKEMIAKEAREKSWTATADSETLKPTSLTESLVQPTQDKRRQRAFVGASTQEKHDRKDSLKPSGESQPSSTRASLEVPGQHERTSLDGLDSTAPNSPQIKASNILSTFIPSIAMDLSSPNSRRASPGRKPALARVRSKIHIFHERNHDRSRDQSRRRYSNTEDRNDINHDSPASPETPDFFRRSLSPTKKNAALKAEENIEVSSKTSGSRRKDDEPSGMRGLFKNHGHVSRVGDLFWKKEPLSASTVVSETDTDESDTGKDKITRIDSAVAGSKDSSNGPSRVSSLYKERRSYINELPSFVSASDGRGRSTRTRTEDTAIFQNNNLSQRRHARENQRLSRFDLLKPPRVDIQNASPTSSPDLAPVQSHNSEFSDIDMRRGSYASDQGRDSRLHPVFGLPVTGLANVEVRRPSMSSQRHWSISDREVPANSGPTTKHEIARVRALLLSSGIKAKEISRRASDLRDLQDPELSSFSDVVNLNREPQLLKPVPRSQEHILAAQILSNDIQLSSRIWQDTAERFSAETVNGLLDRVEDLHNRITGRDGLSEMGRIAADEADALSRDLVTSQTLKVKRLAEMMETMMRRRRRRFRWVRRGGWVVVEWALVGVMWWVWLVVVLIRVIRVVFGGLVGGVKWLLWL